MRRSSPLSPTDGPSVHVKRRMALAPVCWSPLAHTEATYLSVLSLCFKVEHIPTLTARRCRHGYIATSACYYELFIKTLFETVMLSSVDKALVNKLAN